jgi:hypothetical protein
MHYRWTGYNQSYLYNNAYKHIHCVNITVFSLRLVYNSISGSNINQSVSLNRLVNNYNTKNISETLSKDYNILNEILYILL